jgi:hypothetical protein
LLEGVVRVHDLCLLLKLPSGSTECSSCWVPLQATGSTKNESGNARSGKSFLYSIRSFVTITFFFLPFTPHPSTILLLQASSSFDTCDGLVTGMSWNLNLLQTRTAATGAHAEPTLAEKCSNYPAPAPRTGADSGGARGLFVPACRSPPPLAAIAPGLLPRGGSPPPFAV